ncbi:unnamed protein product [Polarella glacialis]|uniref:Protein kinase domain-containing protein n=1 Tax=Polarella glacialis TaxID=89957 RepID=A0A813IHL5_POLGL|nr:unnamed protein product [Polarella glacialis]
MAFQLPLWSLCLGVCVCVDAHADAPHARRVVAQTAPYGATLTQHTARVNAVAFNQEAGLLASASADYTVKVFASSTWDVVATLTLLDFYVSSVAFNQDGGLLALGSFDRTVKVFATSTWAPVATLTEHTSSVSSVAFSQGGGLLSSGGGDETVKVFATSTWAPVATLTEHTSYVLSVAFNQGGGLLASGSHDKTVKVFATSTWAPVATLTGQRQISSVAFNQGGGLLASGSTAAYSAASRFALEIGSGAEPELRGIGKRTYQKPLEMLQQEFWGLEGSVSLYVAYPSVLGVADPSVESCSEGDFQSSYLVHIMTFGITEHWFIKPSDITPDPNSILGSGAFGIVVKGMLHGATEIAIKIPKTRFQSREESQLANEMRLFRHIRHSNIVLFHGATLMVIKGESPSLSLVLEWINGGNFGEYMQQLRSNGVFEADGRVFAHKILLDLARGMTYLHKLMPIILHLDLKPANILVEKSIPPKGKITDFGMSRFARNSLPPHKVGTEKYMAPEVAQRKPYGPAADVFSFGRVIIWTIRGEVCPELISSSSFKRHKDVKNLVKVTYIFQTLDEVASSCLEEDPHMRPNFVQVYDRLTAATTTTPTTTTTTSPSVQL